MRASGKIIHHKRSGTLDAWNIHVPPGHSIRSRTLGVIQAPLPHFRLAGDTTKGKLL